MLRTQKTTLTAYNKKSKDPLSRSWSRSRMQSRHILYRVSVDWSKDSFRSCFKTKYNKDITLHYIPLKGNHNA